MTAQTWEIGTPAPLWVPTAEEIWSDVLLARGTPTDQQLDSSTRIIDRVARVVALELGAAPDPAWFAAAGWYVTLTAAALIDLTLFPEQRDNSIADDLRTQAGVELGRLRSLVTGDATAVDGTPTYWSGIVPLTGF